MMTSLGLTSGKRSLYNWDHILVQPKKKSNRGYLRVRPDVNPNRSKHNDDYTCRLSVLIEKVTLHSKLSACSIEDHLVLIEWLSHAILLTHFYKFLDASLLVTVGYWRVLFYLKKKYYVQRLDPENLTHLSLVVLK